jgi:hypothetical protein
MREIPAWLAPYQGRRHFAGNIIIQIGNNEPCCGDNLMLLPVPRGFGVR